MLGIDVRPNRALEAFCRCEQVFARCTSDIALDEVLCLWPAMVATAPALNERQLQTRMQKIDGFRASITAPARTGRNTHNFWPVEEVEKEVEG